ncbi:MAG: hypothetical protein ACOYJ6_18700 [Caulobacterales bacterium]
MTPLALRQLPMHTNPNKHIAIQLQPVAFLNFVRLASLLARADPAAKAAKKAAKIPADFEASGWSAESSHHENVEESGALCYRSPNELSKSNGAESGKKSGEIAGKKGERGAMSGSA